MQIAVVCFPGSNADWDSFHVARDVLHATTRAVFHKETSLGECDAVIIPGGFSFGDYLRCGAIAGYSPIAADLHRFVEQGGPVIGICNGFQILTEMKLLPGALTRNEHLRFECRDVHLRVESQGPFTELDTGTVLRLPIAHAEGRYQCDTETLTRLEANKQVALRYCDPRGAVTPESNPNGALSSIAGLYNEKRNVLGLMPHPERASEEILGNTDGLKLFHSLGSFLNKKAVA